MGLSALADEAARAAGKCKTRQQLAKVADLVERMRREGHIGDTDYTFLRTYIDVRASRRGGGAARLSISRVLPFMPRGRQASPDRARSRERRRMLGGSNALPAGLRKQFTEGQRAVLAVVADEVRHHGVCAAAIDRIAAIAGVCRTTVQTALYEARRLGVVAITSRPQRGKKNLTNVVEITSREWRRWIDRGVAVARTIGSKIANLVNPTQTSLFISDGKKGVCDHALGAGDRCIGCRQRQYCEGEAKKLGR